MNRVEHLILRLPLVLLLSVFLLGPAAFGFLATFTDYAPAQLNTHWTGLSNYAAVIGDSEFSTSWRNLAVLTLFSVPAELVLGLIIASSLRRPFRGRGLMRILLLLPWLVSPVANGVMWHFLYDSNRGLPSFFLSWLGFPGLPSPLGLPDLALAGAVVADVWRKAPFASFLFLPGILAIPSEYWEQAEIEGATILAQMRYVALPWLRPLILTVALLLLGDTLGTFDNILVLTGGGPGSRTNVPGLYSYRQSFINNNWPAGATAAWLIGMLMILVGFAYLRLVHGAMLALAPAQLQEREEIERHVDENSPIQFAATQKPILFPALGWHTQRRLWTGGRVLALAFLFLVFVLPILWTILASFNVQPANSHSPPLWQIAPSLENYQEVGTTEPGFTDELIVSVALAVVSTTLTVGVAFLAAYDLARTRFRGKTVLLSTFLILASLPVMAYIIPSSALVKALGLYDTFGGVTLAEAAAFAPLAAYILYSYLIQVPIELEEAARLDGAQLWQILRSIVLPTAGAGIAATAVIVFVLAWNQFLIPLVLSLNHVRGIPMGMVDFFVFDRELEWSSVAAAIVSSLLPLIALVLAAHRLLERFTLTSIDQVIG